MSCLVNNNHTGCSKLANMNAGKMERRNKNRRREVDQELDRHRQITKKQLPLLFLPPVAGGRPSNDKLVDNSNSLRIMATMRNMGLPKENRLRNYKHYMVSPSSLHNQDKEEFYNCRQVKERLSHKKKINFVAAKPIKRPLLLPPLPTKTLQGQISKQARESHTSSVKSTSYKTFPKYLPKIETRKSQLKHIDSITHGLTNTSNTSLSTMDKNPPPLRKRTVKPLRAAISSSATLRGLITLDLEEQFIFRFRLSNYDAKDINMTTLNEPV